MGGIENQYNSNGVVFRRKVCRLYLLTDWLRVTHPKGAESLSAVYPAYFAGEPVLGVFELSLHCLGKASNDFFADLIRCRDFIVGYG